MLAFFAVNPDPHVGVGLELDDDGDLVHILALLLHPNGPQVNVANAAVALEVPGGVPDASTPDFPAFRAAQVHLKQDVGGHERGAGLFEGAQALLGHQSSGARSIVGGHDRCGLVGWFSGVLPRRWSCEAVLWLDSEKNDRERIGTNRLVRQTPLFNYATPIGRKCRGDTRTMSILEGSTKKLCFSFVWVWKVSAITRW
eukprot:scaffold183_cov249-Pinguiococcus_pyrenoidosus.AAC.15